MVVWLVLAIADVLAPNRVSDYGKGLALQIL
jgi:hypothetical protein